MFSQNLSVLLWLEFSLLLTGYSFRILYKYCNTMYSLGRYLFLNAIANQLRYPNSHTHYFSCALLSLFAEANTEAVQEQITRLIYNN